MCPDRELLSAWVDGEVPSPWRETIERHIAGCASCSEATAAMRSVRDMFSADAASMDSATDAAKVRIRDRLGVSGAGLYSRSTPFWSRRYSVPFPVAAAAALVLALLGIVLADTGRRNADLRMAVRRAFEATPVATSGMGMESIIDYISKQNAPVNINITLPAEAFGGSSGEPFIIREADYQAGSRR